MLLLTYHCHMAIEMCIYNIWLAVAISTNCIATIAVGIARNIGSIMFGRNVLAITCIGHFNVDDKNVLAITCIGHFNVDDKNSVRHLWAFII